MGFGDFDFQWNQLPFFGNFAGAPGEGAKDHAMRQAAQNYQAYRPEVAQARLNSLNNQMSMYRPVNAALSAMYGKDAQINLDHGALDNPMTNRMMNIGSPLGSAQLEQGKIVSGNPKAGEGGKTFGETSPGVRMDIEDLKKEGYTRDPQTGLWSKPDKKTGGAPGKPKYEFSKDAKVNVASDYRPGKMA